MTGDRTADVARLAEALRRSDVVITPRREVCDQLAAALKPVVDAIADEHAAEAQAAIERVLALADEWAALERSPYAPALNAAADRLRFVVAGTR